MSVRALPVACLRDNYAYLIWNEGSKECVVLDPSEAGPVRASLLAQGLELLAVLNTHHHPDHTRGNLELAREFDVPVYAHVRDRDRIPGLTHTLEEGQAFRVGDVDFSVLHLPGHTQGAITYRTDEFAFTGDTLFTGGCGRLKEGSSAQLFGSLERMKRELGPDVVCCTGHEYTEANLRFAVSLEPENSRVRERLERVLLARRAGAPTAQGTFGEELVTNPFLRAHEPRLARAVGLMEGASAVDVFTRLRELKDDL